MPKSGRNAGIGPWLAAICNCVQGGLGSPDQDLRNSLRMHSLWLAAWPGPGYTTPQLDHLGLGKC